MVKRKNQKQLGNHPFIKPYFKGDMDKWQSFKKSGAGSWTKDKRYPGWVDELHKQGFPNYELWSLDHTMIVLLAERVMAFSPWLEVYKAPTDEGQKQVEDDHKKLLDLLSSYFVDTDDWEANNEVSQQIWELWAKIQHTYWY